ncbi:MAG: phage Gp37/Gp68 family protein, partial [Saprospiraceae bacterium]|nr:phage Gp37/Gp68 family protein [Saprospiraceae bacterium]
QQGVAFFFKQWGAWGEDGVKRSKKANGRILLGREWNEEPRISTF